jgi:hypothetical protein
VPVSASASIEAQMGFCVSAMRNRALDGIAECSIKRLLYSLPSWTGTACFEEWTSAPTCNGQRYNVIESPLLPANEFVY